MSTQTDILKNLDPLNLSDWQSKVTLSDFHDKEKEQMRDQILMLEQEIDRQSTIIDALVKAIRVIERG